MPAFLRAWSVAWLNTEALVCITTSKRGSSLSFMQRMLVWWHHLPLTHSNFYVELQHRKRMQQFIVSPICRTPKDILRLLDKQITHTVCSLLKEKISGLLALSASYNIIITHESELCHVFHCPMPEVSLASHQLISNPLIVTCLRYALIFLSCRGDSAVYFLQEARRRKHDADKIGVSVWLPGASAHARSLLSSVCLYFRNADLLPDACVHLCASKSVCVRES